MKDTEYDLCEEYNKIKNMVYGEELANLSQKIKLKSISKDEYKKYIKYSNIKENMHYLDNIMTYINDMRQKIKQLEKEKDERIRYRELQKEEIYLTRKMKNIEKELDGLKNVYYSEEVDDTEREYLKEQIESDLQDIENKREKIKEIIKAKDKIKPLEERQNYSYEEQKKVIMKIREEVYQFSIVAEQLIRGNTWDESLNYFLNFQRDRLFLDKKERDKIAKDIKQIEYDMKIGNKIVYIAYNYDIIKQNENTR